MYAVMFLGGPVYMVVYFSDYLASETSALHAIR